MGIVDTEGKLYLSNNKYFADAFNFYLYEGREVIKEEELKELDTTGVVAPFGNDARVPVQRYRDVFRIWNAMMDDNAIYVLLGAELQDKVHYGMPVKDGLYDMIGYSKQIEELRKSYKKNENPTVGQTDDGKIAVEDGKLRVKLTSEEFLSGMRKGDKLIPIITLVVYLGDNEWDGPRSLHDMLEFKDEGLRRFVPDYRINLFSPTDMEDESFECFHTSLGFAMKVLKYQRNNADRVIEENGHKSIDRDTAVFLNNVASLNLEFEEEEGGIDMCLAMEKRSQKDKVTGAIEAYRDCGNSEEDIVSRVVEKFNVTREYVLALLASPIVQGNGRGGEGHVQGNRRYEKPNSMEYKG